MLILVALFQPLHLCREPLLRQARDYFLREFNRRTLP